MVSKEEISRAALLHSIVTNGGGIDFDSGVHACTRVDFEAGAEWALSQNKWTPVSEACKKLNEQNHELIMCLFDNGEVLRYNEDHPFAEMTHVCFLPTLPIGR